MTPETNSSSVDVTPLDSKFLDASVRKALLAVSPVKRAPAVDITPASLRVAAEFCISFPVVLLKRVMALSVALAGPTTSPLPPPPPLIDCHVEPFPSVAGSTGGDYVVLTDGSGLTWAISLDKSGADPEPTGAAWVAVNAARKVHVDISGGTNAASVAALVETAFDGLSGSSAIVTDDTAADGTMLLTMAVKAPCTDPAVHNADDSGAGSITGVQTTAGVASQTPTGAAWTAADYKGLADLSSDTTAAQVAARAETALNALTGFTTNITSDDTAADGTMTLTQVNPGAVANVDPHNFNDSSAGSITGVNTSAGNGTADVYVSAAME